MSTDAWLRYAVAADRLAFRQYPGAVAHTEIKKKLVLLPPWHDALGANGQPWKSVN